MFLDFALLLNDRRLVNKTRNFENQDYEANNSNLEIILMIKLI